MWVDFIGSFSTILQEAFHSILCFFSYNPIQSIRRIKAWRSPTTREILGFIISWTNTPTVYLLFHDRYWNQMGVSNVAATIIAVAVMIFLHLRDIDSDLRHCMLDWCLFRLASGGRKKELSQALDFLSVSKKKSIRAHNDYEVVDMAAEGSKDLSVGNQELSTRPAVAKCGETGEALSSDTEVVTPREKRKNSLWWRANARNVGMIWPLWTRW